MKRFFHKTATAFLGATFFLLLTAPVIFAEEPFDPLAVRVGGTGVNSIEALKEKLEIPEVLDSTSGFSSTDTMSQRAILEAIAAGSGGGIVTTGVPGPNTNLVIHQKGVTDNFATKTELSSEISTVANTINNLPQFTIENSTGQNTDRVMSQKATTDTIFELSDDVIHKTSITQTLSNSITDVPSAKCVNDAILTAQTIFNMIYPVDSIYMSVNPTNPSTFFGGVWQTWSEGRVPVGVATS